MRDLKSLNAPGYIFVFFACILTLCAVLSLFDTLANAGEFALLAAICWVIGGLWLWSN